MQRSNEPVRKTRIRINEPGHAHELTFSCYQRMLLLSKDRSRQWVVEALDRARRSCSFELWAYVIMPEHVHVLLLPTRTDYDMGAILKSIKLSVSRRAIRYLKASAPQWLERLRVDRPSGKTEHRFWQQGGGYDRNVAHEKMAWNCVRYIHENPVRRGLVNSATDWRWSSARWYEGLDGVVLPMDGHPAYPNVVGR